MERKDCVTLSQKEQKRLRVIADLEAGRRTAAEAASILGLSQRQVRRLRSGYRMQGATALAHGNRARPSQHRLTDSLRRRIMELGSGQYAACNDSHLRELLALREGIVVSRATIQRIRRQAGHKPKQRRRPPQHRSRRDRRPQEGMLLQVDASLHHWFGPDQPACTLLAAIDDATSKVVAAVFREHEDAIGYFLLLQQVIQRYGLPLDLYHDRHSTFQVNPKLAPSIEDELDGQPVQTQFGRALEELAIGSIAAHSPQAKGRVERLWRTLQDRLVAELALANISDIKGAARVLPDFLKRHNAQLAVEAEEPGLAYRTPDPSLDLDRVLSFRYQRVVAKDNTLSLAGRLIQIPPGPRRRSYFAARVWVHELLDGRLGVWYQDQWLLRGQARELAKPKSRKAQPQPPTRQPLPLPAPAPATPPTLPPKHPWKTWNPAYLNRPRTESLSS